MARIDGPSGAHLIVATHDVVAVHDDATARRIAHELVSSCGTSFGLDTDLDEHALADALRSGRLVVVRLDRPARRLDAPVVHDLVPDLPGFDGVPEPPRPDAWVGVEVIDQHGRPLRMFRAQVLDPTGTTHERALDTAAMARVDAIADDGTCVVTLLAKERA